MASTSTEETIECGEQAAKHFALAPGYRNLNHGSYGTYPDSVREVFQTYQREIEARPDAFIRFNYRPKILPTALQAVETYLKAPPQTCVFAPNTSAGIDTVLRNLIFAPGDAIICFSTVYAAFANTLKYLSETTPLVVEKVVYTLPESHTTICSRFQGGIEKANAKGLNIRLALFDTVNSLPGVRVPFEQLVSICRKEGILSCIDGAHSIGMIRIDISELDPDFYVSNLHKWLYVPRGCAVLYVAERNQRLIRATLPVGFHFVSEERLESRGKGEFVKNFSDIGTTDNAPIACVAEAIRWREGVRWKGRKGNEAVWEYMSDLARTGGETVKKILGTEVLENPEGSLGKCSLTNIKLPLELKDITGGGVGKDAKVVNWMMETMTVEYQTAVCVFTYERELWVRLSAQIYLTIEDFEYAGQKLKETCERVTAGEWTS